MSHRKQSLYVVGETFNNIDASLYDISSCSIMKKVTASKYATSLKYSAVSSMLTSQCSQLCVIDRFITIPICLLLKTEPSMVCFICIFFCVRAWRTKRQIFTHSSSVTHLWLSTNFLLCCFSSCRLFTTNRQCLKHSSFTTACENGVLRIVLIFSTLRKVSAICSQAREA